MAVFIRLEKAWNYYTNLSNQLIKHSTKAELIPGQFLNDFCRNNDLSDVFVLGIVWAHDNFKVWLHMPTICP